MASLRELLQRREIIRTELRDIITKHPDGLPDEVRGRADELEAEATRLNDAERRLAFLNELDQRAQGQPLAGGGDAGFEKLAAQVTAADVLRAQLPGVDDAATGRAKEVSQELARRAGKQPQEGLYFSMSLSGVKRRETRAFSTIAPSTGANLIETEISTTMIDRLRERTIVRSLGATVLGGLQGNLMLPRQKTSTTAYWVADGASLTSSDLSVEQVPLAPKTVGGLTEYSRLMMLQPSIDVAALIEDDLAKILAVETDRVAIVGGTTADQPKGLLSVGSGINAGPSLGALGGVPSWANLIAMIGAVDASNALQGSLGWATNARVVKLLRSTLKTSADTSSTMLMSDPNTLAGYQLQSSQIVPSNLSKSTSGNILSALVYGDFSQLCIGFWDELSLSLNPFDSAAYPRGGTLVRAFATLDIAIRQPLAFCASVEINAP